VVDQALADVRSATHLSEELRATLTFVERLTLDPAGVGPDDVEAAVRAGATPQRLRDAVEVAAVFNTIDRVADALGFVPQEERGLAVSVKRLTTHGYA
jgi:alkylhydroperoxidase family enzyme